MNTQDFGRVMTKLSACFGDRAFNEHRCSRIFKFCKHLSADQFEQIVAGFMDYSRLPPMPGDFLTSIRAKGWVSREQKAADFTMKFGPCGHTIHSSMHEKLKGACVDCLTEGYLPEVIKSPHLTSYIPKELHETAKFFQRQNQEDITTYARRTWASLREIQRTHGLIPADAPKGKIKPEIADALKAVACE